MVRDRFLFERQYGQADVDRHPGIAVLHQQHAVGVRKVDGPPDSRLDSCAFKPPYKGVQVIERDPDGRVDIDRRSRKSQRDNGHASRFPRPSYETPKTPFPDAIPTGRRPGRIVGDRAVAAMKRQARTGEFRANLHRGGGAMLVKIPPRSARPRYEQPRPWGSTSPVRGGGTSMPGRGG